MVFGKCGEEIYENTVYRNKKYKMAGISKLRLKYHGDLKELVVWCIKHNPSLLDNIYEPFMPASEWNLRMTFSGDYDELPQVVVADFRFKQDRWLYWHCPLDFVSLVARNGLYLIATLFLRGVN